VLTVSRGFIAALGGIGMTLLAWYGSWAWPGWPASMALDLLGRFADFPDLSHLLKSIVIVTLIAINVGAWAAVFRIVMLLLPSGKSASSVPS
jgi:hypothetical protein